MSLDKYLKSPSIKKVVDPSIGSTKNGLPNPESIKGKPAELAPIIQPTSFETIVQDIIQEAKLTQTEIQGIINNIYTANKSDLEFVDYYKKVEANHFNPASLLTDPDRKPKEVYSPDSIKASERKVYRNLNDPRAPFIQDLYNLMADAGTVEFLHEKYWKKLSGRNDLYDEPKTDENNLLKLTIAREKQHLDQIRTQARRIENNTFDYLNQAFIRAFANRILQQLFGKREDYQKEINKILKVLKGLRALLVIQSIINSEYWEKFSTNLKEIYDNQISILGNKISKITSQTFLAGVQDELLEFVDGIEDALPYDIDIDSIPEVQEFFNQVDGTLANFCSKIEDDLVSREAISIKTEENRKLMQLNSKKNSKTKQYIAVVDRAITFLEEAKQTISLLDVYGTDANILAELFIREVVDRSNKVRSDAANAPQTQDIVKKLKN